MLLMRYLFVIFFISVSTSAFSYQSEDSLKTEDKQLLIAHRGASAYAPENTMASVCYALEMDFDMIEIDVRLSKDNQVVLLHDKTIKRTSDGRGRLSDYTYDELQGFDFGSWFSDKFKDERIPLLSDVIELVGAKKPLFIEIKTGSYGIEDIVASMIIENKAESWCIVQSFDDRILRFFNKHYPEIRLQKLHFYKPLLLPILIDRGISFYSARKYSFVEAFNPCYQLTWRRSVSRFQNKGFKVYPWGKHSSESHKRLRRMGVSGVIVNSLR
jgi:glycerophosphoryl diester phosphodiesterase